MAFIFTHTLDATVEDWLDKPVTSGRLAFNRPLASAVLTVLVLLGPLIIPQQAGSHLKSWLLA